MNNKALDFIIPAVNQPQYKQAKAKYGDFVDRWLYFTQQGDPLADAVMEDFDALPRGLGMKMITQALEDGIDSVENAPISLIRFFEHIDRVPFWVDSNLMKHGANLFVLNSPIYLAAFTGRVLPLGFCTYINKSFAASNRLIEGGLSRLRANNRHLVESFLPGGLRRDADGFKLSVRIRMIHAQMRFLLKNSPTWDKERLGIPLHAAHIAHSFSAFSAMLFRTGEMLGVKATKLEEKGFMAVWRYVGFLLGVPEEFLTWNVEDGEHLYNVGWALEPDIDDDARLLTHTLVKSAPLVVGIEDAKEQEQLTNLIYNVSRKLLGNEIADKLEYPRFKTPISLRTIRLKTRLDSLKVKYIPGVEQRTRLANMEKLFDVSLFQNFKISFAVPHKVRFNKGDHEAE